MEITEEAVDEVINLVQNKTTIIDSYSHEMGGYISLFRSMDNKLDKDQLELLKALLLETLE